MTAMRIVRALHFRPWRRPVVCRLRVLLLLCLLPAALRLPPASAANSLETVVETTLTAELARARQDLYVATLAQKDGLRRWQAAAAEAEAALTAARDARTELETRIVSVLGEDDPAAVKAVQAEIAVAQIQQETEEARRSLCLKRLEEASRLVETLRQYVQTLELARNLETRILLAPPAEVDGRQKRMEAARKDVTYGEGQVRKYRGRRNRAAETVAGLAERGQETRNRLATGRGLPSPSPWQKRLTQALARQLAELERATDVQREWLLFCQQLVGDAQRGLAYSHTRLLVTAAYEAGLERKALAARHAELVALAEKADRELSRLRQFVDSRLAAVQQERELAIQTANGALAALTRAATAPEQDKARADYDAAQRAAGRWEAHADMLQDLLALQKAVVAFAKDKADKVNSEYQSQTLADIEQERTAQAESASASEQYVQSFQNLLQKLDGQVEAAARELALAPETLKSQAAALAESVPLLATERVTTPQLLEGRLAQAAARLAGSPVTEESGLRARNSIAFKLVFRLAQRELTRQRLAIAQAWLEHTRATIAALERKASALLWQQRDPRLTWTSVCELGTVFRSAWDDAVFAGQAWATGAARSAGYRLDLLHVLPALALVAALLLAGVWGRSRLRRADLPAGTWLAFQVATVIPTPLAAGGLLLTILPGNGAARLLALAAFAVSAWWCLRCGLQACFAGYRFPSQERLGGMLLFALRTLLATGLLFAVVYGAGWPMPNRWNLDALLFHAWWFCMCLEGFRASLHPSLLGRFLSRRSASRGLRFIGACAAWACVGGVALTLIPYLLSLPSLGAMLQHTLLVSFLLLACGLSLTAVAGWGLPRLTDAGPGLAWLAVPAAVRLCKGAVLLTMSAAVLALWSYLLRQVLLSPNAPESVQVLVSWARDVVHRLLGLWHAQLAGGMTVDSLCRGMLVFAASFWVSKLVRRFFLERVLAKTPMDENTRLTFTSVLGYVVIVVGFLVGLNVAGSSIQNLALLAGAITVGLGFGLQNVINNFVSSLLIHFGRTIRVGDYIDAGGQRGTVREIGLRSTMILTDDGVTVLIPNGAFVSSSVVNWSNPHRRTRLHVPITLVRTADLSDTAAMLVQIALKHPLIATTPAPVVEVRGVTPTTVSLELLAWTEHPDKLPAVVGEVSLAADKQLRERSLVP